MAATIRSFSTSPIRIDGSRTANGHAEGEDLFVLEELPIAIAPGDGDDGIWTGSILVPDPTDPLSARAFYTSVSVPNFAIGRVRVARPLDTQWVAWEKGPILVDEPPAAMTVRAFRDPFIVRDGDRLRALVGAALGGEVAGAIAYEISADGEWTLTGVAASRPSSSQEGSWMGTMWECPQLTFVDNEGRNCVISWMREIQALDRSWTGAHSIPYIIESGGNGIMLRPHPDLDKYRVVSGSGWAPVKHVRVRSDSDARVWSLRKS